MDKEREWNKQLTYSSFTRKMAANSMCMTLFIAGLLSSALGISFEVPRTTS